MKRLFLLFALTFFPLSAFAAATSGDGTPTNACAFGDTYTQLDNANRPWTCINYLGIPVWAPNSSLFYNPNPVGGNGINPGGTLTQAQLTALLANATINGSLYVQDPTTSSSQQVVTAHYLAAQLNTLTLASRGPGIYIGAGVPNASAYNVGDLYLNSSANYELYGPKQATGTIWPDNGPLQTTSTTGTNGSTPILTTGNVTAVANGQLPTFDVRNTGGSTYALDLGLPLGPTGATGPAPTMTGGTVTTLATGAQPTVSVSATGPGAYAINLGLPPGTQGPAGPAPAISIGTVTTAPAGGNPSATLTLIGQNSYALNLVLPSGTGTTSGGGSGGGGGITPINGGGTDPGSGIGTVAESGVMTDNSFSFKTCYVGSSVCSGGVGSAAPAAPPTHIFGEASPSASTGTANAVGTYTLQSASQGSFVDALWTTSGGGLGSTDKTWTNAYRSLYFQTAFAAGQTHIELDTYYFDGTWDWMLGLQCNATNNLVQYANQKTTWANTSIPCSGWRDGKYHHLEITYHRGLDSDTSCSGAPCEYWDTLTLDGGNVYALGVSLPATSTTWAGSGGQTQLDFDATTASSADPATDIFYEDTDLVQFGSATANGGGGTNPGGGAPVSGGNLDNFTFDTGTPASVGLTAVGSPVYGDTTHPHTTPGDALFPAGNNYYTDVLSAPTQTIYSAQYVWVSSLGTNSMGILRYYNGSSELWVWYISPTGYLTYYNEAAAASVTVSTAAMSTGAYHLVETYTNINPTTGNVIVKIDGATVYTSANTLNTGNSTITSVWFGSVGSTAPTGWGNTYMDNVGFSSNAWIGPS
jgi:hypothetical protein